MITKADAFRIISEHHDGIPEWLNDTALSVPSYIDPIGKRHPSFVVNFSKPHADNLEFTQIKFGLKFYLEDAIDLRWLNARNAEIQYAKLFWDEDGVALSMDVYAPNASLTAHVFEQNYALFDYIAMLIRASIAD